MFVVQRPQRPSENVTYLLLFFDVSECYASFYYFQKPYLSPIREYVSISLQ